MKKKIYVLNMNEDQVKVLYDAVAQTLGLKRLYDGDESEIAKLEEILKRLSEIDLMIHVNKAHEALIRKGQNGE